MKSQLQRKLFNDYPDLYSDRTRPPTESLMCFGITCGDGWYNIIDSLSKCISHHVENEIRREIFLRERLKLSNIFVDWSWGWHKWRWYKDIWRNIKEYIRLRKPLDIDSMQVRAVQVKEKFGGLRFYIVRANDEILGMIQMAEEMSYVTCEECGKPGFLHHKGTWLKTLCTVHAKKSGYKKYINS